MMEFNLWSAESAWLMHILHTVKSAAPAEFILILKRIFHNIYKSYWSA